jgi:carbonic anhydrase
MPLDASDRVRMPQDLLNLNELLPTDQRYYQFMGSLTTPPCSENVLWMVLKQPVSISRSADQAVYPALPQQRPPGAAAQRTYRA